MTVLMKRKGNNVNVGGLKFKIDSGITALGFLANNASAFQAGEMIRPPFIIDKAGNKRPLFTKYDGIKINEILLYDVEKSENAYIAKVHTQVRALDKFKEAFNKVTKCKIAQTERRKDKNVWVYKQYKTEKGYDGQFSIWFDWKEEKNRTKPKNLQAAKDYEEAEHKLGRINKLVRTYADILQRSIFHNLGEEYHTSKNPKENKLEVFIINGRQYMFEWGYQREYYALKRYSFPSAYTKDVIKTMALKNNTKRWPFTEDAH